MGSSPIRAELNFCWLAARKFAGGIDPWVAPRGLATTLLKAVHALTPDVYYFSSIPISVGPNDRISK
jgi:hypothetical protein